MEKRIYPADLAELPQVLAFLEDTLEQCHCPPNITMRMCIAMEELFVNICRYAYPEEAGTVEMALTPDRQAVTVVLSDSGIPFDPLQREDPDIAQTMASSKVGGFGIYLVKKTMDSICYQYENGKNVLTMVKKWD